MADDDSVAIAEVAEELDASGQALARAARREPEVGPVGDDLAVADEVDDEAYGRWSISLLRGEGR